MKHLSELRKDQRPTLHTHPHLSDAEEPFVFIVQYDCDVRGATVGDIAHCAGANGIRRVPGVVDARVLRSCSYVEFEDGSIKKFRNPVALNHAVDGFDTLAGVFPPGEYRLVPPSASDRVGQRHRRSGPHHPNPTRRHKVISLR